MKSSQRGTTLLEVLVSILVLAVGLLGYAGLQALSMKNNNNAFLRSQATALAADVMERVRANKAGGVASGDVTNWQAEVAAALPSGNGAIIQNANGTIQVTISWQEQGSSTTQQFITQSRL